MSTVAVFGLSGGLHAACSMLHAAPIIAASNAASRTTIRGEGVGGAGDVTAGSGEQRELRKANRSPPAAALCLSAHPGDADH
jgi:hypothetical protein